MQPQIGIVTGFGDKGISNYKIRLQQEFPDYKTFVIAGCPIESSRLYPYQLAQPIRDLIKSARRAAVPLILTAHSYGCNPALIAACEENLKGIDAAFFIDGPLNPHVDVLPPPNGMFDGFQTQYDHRVATMAKCELALAKLDRSKLLTFGAEYDLIVPPAAKRLLGVQHVGLSGRGHNLNAQKIDQVVNYIREFMKKFKILVRDERGGVAREAVKVAETRDRIPPPQPKESQIVVRLYNSARTYFRGTGG